MTDSPRENRFTTGQAGRVPPEILRGIIYTIRENRQTFEEALIKIVRALLNKQAERPALKQEHKDISDLKLEGFRRKKHQAESVSNSLNNLADSAPTLPSAAAKIAIGTGSSIAGAYYENEQVRHIENEAQKNLTSAQFERYTTAQKHYTLIACKTARTISFEFQFLLLGISSTAMKELLTLFKESMDKYGVKRLQENFSEKTPEEVSNALTDAAIPPPSDNVLYRQWLRINFTKWEFNLKFLSRIRLNKDDAIQAILAKGGPELQMIFGTSSTRINYKNLSEEELGEYTELGALNHAYVLCQEEFRLAGLDERAHELEGFTFKYPLILKREDRTLGNLGINVLPRPTRMSLPEPLRQTILDIVPDFHKPATVSQQEILEGRVILPDYTKIYLPHRKNYVPWSKARQEELNERYKVIFTAGKESETQTDPNEITSVPGHARLLAMEEAGNNWDLDYARKDVEYAARKAQEALNNIYDAESDDLTRTKQRLDATRAAKYLAISTSNFLHFILKCRNYSQDDLSLAATHIESARTTLNAARIAPIQEATDHHSLKQGIVKIKSHAAQCEQVQFSYMQSIEALLDDFIPFESTFFTEEQQAIAQKRKRLLKGINEDVSELRKLTKMAKAITESRNNNEEVEQQTEAASLEEFDQAANTLHARIFTLENAERADIADIIKNIELYALETRIIHNLISRADGRDISADINDALRNANECFTTAQTIESEQTRWQKRFPSDNRRRLLRLRDDVIRHRETCLTRLTELETATNSSDILGDQDKLFFRRAKAYNKLTRILYLISNKADDESLQRQAQALKEKVKAIYLALRDGRADLASSEFDDLITDEQQVTSNTTLEDIIIRANQVADGREQIAMAISGDIEMTNLALKQANLAMDKVSAVEREMLKAEGRLDALITELETEPLIESANHSDIPSGQQLIALRAALTTENPGTVISTLDLYTKKIYDVLSSIIASDERSSSATTDESNTDEDNKSEEASRNKAPIKSEVLSSIASLLPNIETNTSLDATSTHAKSLQESEQQIQSQQDDHPVISPFSGSEAGSTHSINSAVTNWPAWLVFKAVKLQLHNLLHSPNGIEKIATTARNELKAIQKIADEEPNRLTENKRIALREIKRTYQIIHTAMEKQAIITPTSCNQEVANDVVVQGVLDWSSHLTYDEQVWRDDAHDRNQEIIRQNQQEFIEEALIINTELFGYIGVAITNLKQQKNMLTGLNNRINGKVTEIERLYPPGCESRRNPDLNRISSNLKHLGAIIAIQLEELNAKIDRLANYIQTYTKQNLRAYFRVWKLEVRPKDQLDDELPTVAESKDEETSAKKPVKPAVTEKKTKSISRGEYDIMRTATSIMQRSEAKVKRDAETYTFDDIKKHYDLLHRQLTTVLDSNHLNRHSEESDEDDMFASSDHSPRPLSPAKSSKALKRTFNNSLRVSNSNIFTDPPSDDTVLNSGSKPLITELSTTYRN